MAFGDGGACEDHLARLHGPGEPHAAADDAIAPDAGLPAQDGGAGIDDHPVPDVRVPLDSLHRVPVGPQLKALGAQGHVLVQLHVLPDGGGLADDHARAVVDKEGVSDGGPRVDVDARGPVGVLRHHPREQRDLFKVQHVRQPVRGDSGEGGVAEDDLIDAGGGRVPLVGGGQVRHELAMDLRQGGEQGVHHSFQIPVRGQHPLEALRQQLRRLQKRALPGQGGRGVGGEHGGDEPVRELLRVLPDASQAPALLCKPVFGQGPGGGGDPLHHGFAHITLQTKRWTGTDPRCRGAGPRWSCPRSRGAWQAPGRPIERRRRRCPPARPRCGPCGGPSTGRPRWSRG